MTQHAIAQKEIYATSVSECVILMRDTKVSPSRIADNPENSAEKVAFGACKTSLLYCKMK